MKEQGDGWMIRSPFVGDMEHTYKDHRSICIELFVVNWPKFKNVPTDLAWCRLKYQGFKCVKAHVGPGWRG